MIENFLQHCCNLVIDPGYRIQYLHGLKDEYTGIIGYLSNYIPQEIIAAAGCHPVRIIGAFGRDTSHQHPLFNPVCSLVQDVYAVAASDAFEILDCIIFPNSCDSLKLLHQLWDEQIKHPPAWSLRHPVQSNQAAVKYFAEQLKRFADEIQIQFGTEISEDRLRETIAQYNHTRSLLRQIYKSKKTTGFPAFSQMIALITAGMIMDRREYNQQLETVLRQAEQSIPQSAKPAKHIMLIGPVMDNLAMLQQVEELGIEIVDDDLTNGTRYIGQDVQTEGDPYENLARRYLSSAPSPTLYTDPQSEDQAFRDRIEALKPDGVLFIIQKFCEPHIHNYLAKSECLRQMSIPVQHFEIEHNAARLNERQIMQLETFAEVTKCHPEIQEHDVNGPTRHSERSEESI